jgi:hypothetical protein
MALRLDDSVVRGELDNTVRGRVTGRLWLLNQEEPIAIDLAGDCWCDLAGRRITFVNPNPQPTPRQRLSGPQTGQVGDITASRKVRVPALPLDEWLNRRRLGLEAPECLGNALYVEWYSERDGRVVIETATFGLEVSLPEWEMTVEQETDQRRRNAVALRGFLDRLEARLCPNGAPRVPEDRDMDEFEWERFFRASDARGERFGELLEKYGDHPDRDRIVAREMGWHELLRALDEQEAGHPIPMGGDWHFNTICDGKVQVVLPRLLLGIFDRNHMREMSADVYRKTMLANYDYVKRQVFTLLAKDWRHPDYTFEDFMKGLEHNDDRGIDGFMWLMDKYRDLSDERKAIKLRTQEQVVSAVDHIEDHGEIPMKDF